MVRANRSGSELSRRQRARGTVSAVVVLLVGELTPNYDALEIPADPGQTIVAYTAEPDSPSQQALDLLASWAATPDEAPAGTAEYDSRAGESRVRQ